MSKLEAFFIDNIIKDCNKKEDSSHHLKLTLLSQSCMWRLQWNANTWQTWPGTWAPWVSQQSRGEHPAWVRCCSGTASAANPLLGAAHGKSTAYYTRCSNESRALHWQSWTEAILYIRMMHWFKIGLRWLVFSCFTTVPFLWANKASVLNRRLDYHSHRINFKLRNRWQEKVISCSEKNFSIFQRLGTQNHHSIILSKCWCRQCILKQLLIKLNKENRCCWRNAQ